MDSPLARPPGVRRPYPSGKARTDPFSQGSRFFKREQQRDALVSEKVAKMQADLAAFRQQDPTAATRYVEALVQQLEAQRDLSRTVVHVDMDGACTSREGAGARDCPKDAVAKGSAALFPLLPRCHSVLRQRGDEG